MVTKIPHTMTTGVVGTTDLCSRTPSGKAGGNAGKVVQLDDNGEVPPALLSPCIDQHRITVDQAITTSAADILLLCRYLRHPASSCFLLPESTL